GPEVRAQRALALLADAGDFLEHRLEVALAPQLAVERDREPVRFVAQPREQMQLARVLAQHDGVFLARQEDALGAALDGAFDETTLLAGAPEARRPGLCGGRVGPV